MRMAARNEIVTALQLVGLLSLLIWSFTWNLPPDSDGTHWQRKRPIKSGEKSVKENLDFQGKPFSPTWDKYSVILDSFKIVTYAGNKLSKDSSSDNAMLPPFNVWKEVELTKQGKSPEQRDKAAPEKSRRRKLNYASAKCGAKILASNPEAKYRVHILNEKVDEYMLNPCDAKTWFIVELCDTIEATQIELVNYELYSSTPKDFTASWSDVYPTQIWHSLGTFGAKDQRTMQSFDLPTKNLGKFIKVTIWSHHGQEHYCPLSVFRVLGYSMVYEYDDIDMKNEGEKKTEATVNMAPEETKVKANSTARKPKHGLEKDQRSEPRERQSDSVSSLLKMNQEERLFSCSKFLDSGKICFNKPYCLLLQRIVLLQANYSDLHKTCRKNNFEFSNYQSPTELSIPSIKNSSLLNSHPRPANDLRAVANISNQRSGSLNNHQEIIQRVYSTNDSKILTNESEVYSIGSTGSKKINGSVRDSLNFNSKLQDSKRNVGKSDYKLSEHKNTEKHESVSEDNNQCRCPKQAKNFKSSESDSEAFLTEHLPSDESAESAALIQKESVLVKLTMRIKMSEVNLNLINRYLQELSKFYRQEMEDMQNMFNGTVKALRIASEKAAAIDSQQQVSIERLECKMSTLNKKLDYLTQGQDNIWKQVLELHGFFLIMEFIIMTTIFSIFLNKMKKIDFRKQ